ncbi:prepilin peptidase [Actinoplanes sp. NBRC 103695]|uniref:prepilin peptidase n=1 Tax=Actinoplanes sp. NBRC 103695 TaxID=3032202 RepID=UPI0024A4CFE9|nr:prepilin peptidase [Actinoplanes sp. NBRC 103695]GLZ01877.1 hypothetical protein Acsp02_91280 [Actinoplanes sp. NBRC 103695]
MNALATTGCAIAGALAGVPIAAITYSVPPQGRICVPRRWWHGAPARPMTVAAVSLLTGAAAGIVTGRLPPSPALPAFWLFAVLGVGLAIIDLRRHRLPHAMTAALVVSCILCFISAVALGGDPSQLLRAVAAGSITAFVLLILAFMLPGQLGLGDIALAGAITLNLGWLSWETAALGMSGGLLLQGAVAAVLRLCTRSRSTGMIPMGPALVAGWLVSVVLRSV